MSLRTQPHLNNLIISNQRPTKGERAMLIKIILISMLALNIFALLSFIVGAIVLISVARANDNKYLI